MPLIYESVDRPVKGAVITGYDGPARFIDVPQVIGGEPVLELGDHAFSGKEELQEVRIADGVSGIGRYAFYNCRNLRKLVLTDSVDGCGDGALRMCRSLRRIEITMYRGGYRIVKDLVDDTEEELHLELHFPDGGTARLTFPGYYSEIREDFEARVIHQSIRGAGFTYRQCVSRHGIDYEAYDQSFERATYAGGMTAGLIAIERLMFPVGLTEKAEKVYLEYLSENVSVVLLDRVEAGDDAAVRLLTGDGTRIALEDRVLDAAIKRASELKQTEICGVLMEAVRMRKPSGGSESFEFEL